ncbi:MAG TPA: hypothetical protein VKP67_01005 [Xanthobacteraceae bacterium]|nr:hypothetical protein [Xanthobacteraceae bacterium]
MTDKGSKTEFTRIVFNWLDQAEADHELAPAAFKVAYEIRKHFDWDTLRGYRSLKNICQKTGLCKGTVVDGLRALEARKHLAVVQKGTAGRGHSYEYQMVLKGPKPGQLGRQLADAVELARGHRADAIATGKYPHRGTRDAPPVTQQLQ